MNLIFPVLFGLEKPLKDELLLLSYTEEQIRVEDGQLSLLLSDDRKELSYAVARCNVYLRCAERCQLELFRFYADDFSAFFEQCYACAWEDFIPFGAEIRVQASSRNSKLFAVSALQSLLKKALVKRLLQAHGEAEDAFYPEWAGNGSVQIRAALVADQVSLRVDTSGAGLHKRAYRPLTHAAPLKETLAAGLLSVMRWRPDGSEGLADLFCGSATIAIEAACMATATAAGSRRSFAFENWPYILPEALAAVKCEAEEARLEKIAQLPDHPFILASDIDAVAVEMARDNAARAGVAQWICFSVRDATAVDCSALRDEAGCERLLLLSNPPYGERMMDEESVYYLEQAFSDQVLNSQGELPEGLRWGLLTADDDFERVCGFRADKRRKLYNGMIKCYLYQYFRKGQRNFMA